MLKSLVRQSIQAIIEKMDYKMVPANEPPRGFEAFTRLYNRYATPPPTVIDVGVGRGTPWLYAGFPKARLILVEPLQEFAGDIEKILSTREGIWHACGLAAEAGAATINISSSQPTGSSLLARASQSDAAARLRGDVITDTRSVPLQPLDALLANESGPFALKIDVEGAELDVLRGAPAVLAKTDLVLVECCVMQRFVGQCDVIDIAAHLKACGFALADIVTLEAGGPDRRLVYLDAAFVRPDSRLLQPGNQSGR